MKRDTEELQSETAIQTFSMKRHTFILSNLFYEHLKCTLN